MLFVYTYYPALSGFVETYHQYSAVNVSGGRNDWRVFLLPYCKTLDCFVAQHHPALSEKGRDGAGLLATTNKGTILFVHHYCIIARLCEE